MSRPRLTGPRALPGPVPPLRGRPAPVARDARHGFLGRCPDCGAEITERDVEYGATIEDSDGNLWHSEPPCAGDVLARAAREAEAG